MCRMNDMSKLTEIARRNYNINTKINQSYGRVQSTEEFNHYDEQGKLNNTATIHHTGQIESINNAVQKES